jgi:hypothetical protein
MKIRGNLGNLGNHVKNTRVSSDFKIAQHCQVATLQSVNEGGNKI